MDTHLKFEFEDFQKRWPNIFKDVYCGFSLPKGWNTIVWKLCERLEREGCEELGFFQVAQVKEKFGGLRFYYDLIPDVIEPDERQAAYKKVDDKLVESIRKSVSFVENMSFEVCENCGTTVDVIGDSGGGWWNTRCTPCRTLGR